MTAPPPPSVTYDATGGGQAALAASLSWSHTTGANATAVIVGVATAIGEGVFGATWGSTPMTLLDYSGASGAAYSIALFGLIIPAGGTTQTVTVNLLLSRNSSGCSVSYNNVQSFGAPVSQLSSTGTALSLNVPSYNGEMVAQVFYATLLSAYNQTSRYNGLPTAGDNLILGDAAGASPSVSFTATTTGAGWGAIGVPLSPVGYFTPISVTTNQTNAAVPDGATGCFVALVSGGGGGAAGGATGGGGGGGGSFIYSNFIPVSALGASYSLTIGAQSSAGGAGHNSTFTSGNTSLTAGAGSAGSGSTGGNGGTTTITGLSLATNIGIVVNGGNGAPAGSGGANSLTYAAAGGGGGATTTSGSGIGGGQSYGQATGGSGGSPGVAGGSPASSPAGQGGAGGGGGGGGSTGAAGGDGGLYGGGGGGGGNASGAASRGAAGYGQVYWI